MKIKLNSEALRMVVLKQIVANASLGMKTEREMSFISRIFPFTPSNFKLSRLHDRGINCKCLTWHCQKIKTSLLKLITMMSILYIKVLRIIKMTKEEAKKMGATHCDEFGNYYMSIDRKSIVLLYQLIDNEWTTPLSMFLNPKPL